jgi:hypothetical protein
MSASSFTINTTFLAGSDLQPSLQTPSSVPTYSDANVTSAYPLYVTLAAAGTSFTIPVPSTWTHVDAVHVANVDTTGYCMLTLNATSGAPAFMLNPNGAPFACSIGQNVPAGAVAANVGTWTLKSCDSSGVTANGAATKVYVYLAGH